jgi:hypothetical protein
MLSGQPNITTTHLVRPLIKLMNSHKQLKHVNSIRTANLQYKLWKSELEPGWVVDSDSRLYYFYERILMKTMMWTSSMQLRTQI